MKHTVVKVVVTGQNNRDLDKLAVTGQNETGLVKVDVTD